MDAVAIQDANKIRVAMGLAPLPVPGEDPGLQFKSKDDGEESDPDDMSTLEKRQAAAGDNWKRLQDEEKAKKERLARKEALKKARDAELRFAKLEGKGLGDAEEADMDTKTWLLQQKKRQKKIEKARKYEEEQAEIERQAQAEYTAKDLAGVKVAHELDQFDAEGEQILTLKDTEIGDESEEDELENLDLRAKERLQEKLERKKNKPVYNPNDTDDTNRSILAHYDEEIEGKKKKAFTLDTSGAIDQAAVAAQREAQEAERTGVKGIKISLDILKDDTPTSDYQDPSTAKIRKPKKPKKAKTTRQRAADDDDIFPVPAPQPAEGQMEVDSEPASNGAAKKRTFEFDDDDLQAKLAEQRRQALKKRKKTDAAELARRIREEESATPMNTGEDEEEPGLVIDETTEFVANLRRPQSPSPAEDRPRATSTPAVGNVKDEDEDTAMAESYAAVEDEEEIRARREAEEREKIAAPAITSTGFEEEETTTSGVGAALNMLRKRGLVQDSDAEKSNAAERARSQFLAENQALIDEYDQKTREARERDRKSGRFDRMSHREREAYSRQQNEQREAYLASLQAEHFKRAYRPNVQLRYNDEFGREMNQKEAFKHLSHMFHGKGSGKQKTEKRIKKIEEEKEREKKSSLGTSTNEAVGAAARKNRQAGVRLQ